MSSNSNRALATNIAMAATSTSTSVICSTPVSTVSDAGRGYAQGPGPGYGQSGQTPTYTYPYQPHNYPYMPNTGQLQPAMMTQPVYVTVGSSPNTMCPLIVSAIMALFCGFLCGAGGIVFSWKARMQSLKQRYEEANHSICIAWIFVGLAFLFGFIIWGTTAAFFITYREIAKRNYP